MVVVVSVLPGCLHGLCGAATLVLCDAPTSVAPQLRRVGRTRTVEGTVEELVRRMRRQARDLL